MLDYHFALEYLIFKLNFAPRGTRSKEIPVFVRGDEQITVVTYSRNIFIKIGKTENVKHFSNVKSRIPATLNKFGTVFDGHVPSEYFCKCENAINSISNTMKIGNFQITFNTQENEFSVPSFHFAKPMKIQSYILNYHPQPHSLA